MKNSQTIFAVALAVMLAPCLGLAQGDKPAKPEPEAQPAQSQPKPARPQPQPFTLTITVKESASGKPIVERSYTLTIVADGAYDNASLRDGDRVPYMGEKGREYFDVGTNIDAVRASRTGDGIFMSLHVTSNSLLAKADGVNLPQVNQWNISVVPILVPGVPAVVYSAADALTGRKVEIQATAQLLGTK